MLLGDGKIDNHQNWKGRFKDNSDKMRTGSIYDMADVLKSLTFLAQVEEPVVPREAHARSRQGADHLGDLEVMQTTAQAIEDRVNEALEKCFMTKARNTQRAVRSCRHGQGRSGQGGGSDACRLRKQRQARAS